MQALSERINADVDSKTSVISLSVTMAERNVSPTRISIFEGLLGRNGKIIMPPNNVMPTTSTRTTG